MTSSKSDAPLIIGVLNVTKDSFSDGGVFLETEDALRRAHELMDEGAFMVDVGGDSTRPGSRCVGPDEEWRRIGPVLRELGSKIPVCVDTHHSEIAKRALDCGAKWINDVSAGGDPGMFPVIASSGAKIVLTYTRCVKPHQFGPPPQEDIVSAVRDFLARRTEQALAGGVKRDQIVLDPGMGAFLSDDAQVSFELLRRFGELGGLNLPVMLSASRKGFLRFSAEKQAKDRDPLSAYAAASAWKSCAFTLPHFVRVHNVALHKEFFSIARSL